MLTTLVKLGECLRGWGAEGSSFSLHCRTDMASWCNTKYPRAFRGKKITSGLLVYQRNILYILTFSKEAALPAELCECSHTLHVTLEQNWMINRLSPRKTSELSCQGRWKAAVILILATNERGISLSWKGAGLARLSTSLGFKKFYLLLLRTCFDTAV
jgi:hypothetical protein